MNENTSNRQQDLYEAEQKRLNEKAGNYYNMSANDQRTLATDFILIEAIKMKREQGLVFA